MTYNRKKFSNCIVEKIYELLGRLFVNQHRTKIKNEEKYIDDHEITKRIL